MTSVCSVGLDMIAIPGSTSAATVSAIIADEAAIGVVNNKTTAVRVIPVCGKDEGEVEFGGLLGRAPIMPVGKENADAFIARGGRIPAPYTATKTDFGTKKRGGADCSPALLYYTVSLVHKTVSDA